MSFLYIVLDYCFDTLITVAYLYIAPDLVENTCMNYRLRETFVVLSGMGKLVTLYNRNNIR